jgi:hypothetical protein
MAAITAFTGLAQKPTEPTFRTPPRNTEAESALLGAIMVHNEAFDTFSNPPILARNSIAAFLM